MEEYAGRILADRYRLPLPPTDEYELVETRAFDTRSGQEVLVRQVPLPELVDAEMLDGHRAPAAGRRSAAELPAVRRAIEAAQAAAAVPDHPRLDQVFDVFAEGGSLWIVSELVPARPLAALIADEPLTPYRAAEVASDVLTALRVLHAHGWTHRNITVRTVLVCDDGRVMLTGLAAGAAEDALCGYDPVPGQDSAPGSGTGWDAPQVPGGGGFGHGPQEPYGLEPVPASEHVPAPLPAPVQPVQPAQPGPADAPLVAPGYDTGPRYRDHITPGRPEERPDPRAAARAGAVAAYRAGARAAAARVIEERRAGAGAGAGAEPAPEARPEGSTLPHGYSYPYGGPQGGASVPWHGATPRRPALPSAGSPEQAQGPEQGRLYDPAQDQGQDQGQGQGRGRGWAQDREQGQGQGRGWAQDRRHDGEQDRGQEGAQGQDQAWAQDQEQGQLYDPAQDREQDPQSGPEGRYAAPAGPQALARAEQPSPPWPGAQPQNGSARPALPAQLALPQGYRQAEARAEARAEAAEARAGTHAEARARAQAGVQPAARAEAVDVPRQVGADGWAGGPRTGLDAERARLTRMAVVGAVTERWAPEQARAVTGPWQLAAPVGPATDLWALGALLYRAVQGHAPYPEDGVSELVEMVCSEPPAFAEECGALRPVVESLLRQDPTERPDFEELRGWLRSLVRSAPEPEAGFAALPMPEPDPARLPVVRRRGDLHGRHRNPAAPRKPRALGRTLLVGILVLLAGAVAYAMVFMPRAGEEGRGGAAPTPSQGPTGSPSTPGASSGTPTGTPESKPAPQTATSPAAPAAPAPAGYTSQQDPEHFEIVVPNGWERRGINEAGQVRYTDGQFALTVVPGRDKVEGNPDPAAYQKDKEQELTPYRTSTWSTVSEVKSTKVGQQLRATGKYTWIDGNGRSVVARNFVVALGGSYHVVVVTGPQDEEGKVTEVFEKATASYRAGG
ncbi:protein kinase [Streptomyces xanthophaeus]|uniref:protein kinase n=1 Tax=Streptomyces xanthophaeus TaxID=67385 RepID=UPI0037171FEE